jgi:hypothetical protein
MTVVGYISDLEGIFKVFWSLFQHDGVAAFKLSESSPLPPAVSANDLPGGRIHLLCVRRIRRINCHPVKSDEDSTPESNCTMNICCTGMATWIIQMTPMTIAPQTLGLL